MQTRQHLETVTIRMRIAIPDYISNSYFPAIAAVELGFLKDEGVDANIELLFPVTDAAAALRDGSIDLLAGAAHAPFYAFPAAQGARILASLSQNMYWFLIVRADLPVHRGELGDLRNVRIGAAPGPDIGLQQMLADAGVDLEASGVQVGPIPSSGDSSSVSFGVSAAKALADGKIDAFWANGMGAEVAVRQGTGKVVVDARRDGAPGDSLTFPALISTEELMNTRTEEATAAVRAIVRTQAALRREPALAGKLGERLFPAEEASLITTLIERDRAFYQAEVTEEAVAGLNRLAMGMGLLQESVRYESLVATEMSPLWSGASA